jgi:oligopeptide transport system permease protein
MADYNSTRIEGEEGIQENGKTYYYAYGRKVDGGIEVRAEYYEYYIYQHTQVKKDGITEPTFWFGTTSTGKDIFACLSYGARFSFVFAIIVAIVNLVVGVVWGSISGYYGGKLDLAMERFTDILGGLPWIVVMTLCIIHMGQNFVTFAIALCLTGWIGTSHTTRTQFYRYKRREYVLASRTLGAKDFRLIFKHILPNAMGTIITGAVLMIPSIIFSEATISYLGLGLKGMSSLGVILSNNQTELLLNPYLLIFPACVIALLMIAFNLFGNGLRDAVNPSLKGEGE